MAYLSVIVALSVFGKWWCPVSTITTSAGERSRAGRRLYS